MMVEVVVGLQDLNALIDYAPPILTNKYLITASSAFEGSAFQRRLRKTDAVEESRGTLVFDGGHSFMNDMGSFSGKIFLYQRIQILHSMGLIARFF